jgi:DNA-binding transcriptional LysR family regulator
MSQPAVTLQIKQLEALYRKQLFERHHGSITLTPAGELVLSYAEKIIALSDEMEGRLAEMTGEMRGLLLIGACSSIGESMLAPVLSEFNALYPQVRVRLLVANSETVARRVAERVIDLGLIAATLKVPGVKGEVCGSDELIAICAADYPLTGKKAISPTALAEYEYIAREPGSGTREATDAYFRNHQVDPQSLKMQMELGSPEAVKSVVAQGIGFAIVSRWVVEKELEQGTLIGVALKPPLQRNLLLIYPDDSFRTRLADTFMRFAKNKLQEFAG